MKKISVVVPLYRGKQFISIVLAQLECCVNIVQKITIELVFSNDDPDPEQSIPENIKSDKLDVIVLNATENHGIHGARQQGFLHSTGDYILFLDQDDRIAPEYFASQLSAIGSADAVVCNAISDGRLKYNVDRPLARAASRESMIREGNMILSPGQVLMRREAVPKSWMEHTMRHNGADDWLLWLCMHSEGRSFALNPEALFVRQVHYQNASFDSGKMALSEREVVEIIEAEQMFCPEERRELEKTLVSLQKKRLQDNAKWKKMFLVQNDWFCFCNRNVSIADFLRGQGINKTAIYGYGYLGKALLENLRHDHMEVSYVIDKNAAYLHADVKCCTLEDSDDTVEAVIVTLVSGERQITQHIKDRLNVQVFWLEDVIAILSGRCRTGGGVFAGQEQGKTDKVVEA